VCGLDIDPLRATLPTDCGARTHIYPSHMQLSRRSRNKWADFCSGHGTLRLIEDAYAAHDVLLPPQWGPPPSSQRRALVAAAEETLDLADPGVQQRLLATYLDGIEDWGRATDAFIPVDYDDVLVPEARARAQPATRRRPIAEDGTTHPAHCTIRHTDRVYASGDVHTQTIEGFFGNVKNGIAGNYHGVSAKWPPGYLNEYTWRYNHRRDGRAMFMTLLLRAAV
jgi:hypothetical protein